MFKLEDVCNYFLSKSAMTRKKFQGLVYYAYAWTLALLNDNIGDIKFRLVNERPEAWVHGAVFPELYNKYKEYGWDNIPAKSKFDENVFPPDVLDVLNQVWETYGTFSADNLEYFCRHEWPWRIARVNLAPFEPCSTKLDDEYIFKYYIEQTIK